jgi:hypothetical protein
MRITLIPDDRATRQTFVALAICAVVGTAFLVLLMTGTLATMVGWLDAVSAELEQLG